LTPDIGDAGGPGHDRDADARPKPMHAREDRILANESYCAAGVFGRQSETTHDSPEMRVDVETCRHWWCNQTIAAHIGSLSTFAAAPAVITPTIGRRETDVIGADDSAESNWV
jgi:hypothetical protein